MERKVKRDCLSKQEEKVEPEEADQKQKGSQKQIELRDLKQKMHI